MAQFTENIKNCTVYRKHEKLHSLQKTYKNLKGLINVMK